ncbi:MAG: hypothetical protein HQK51_13420 [Oligoflexia bacterium]|nr:hypothetical protein [Oligoflexia bacterium]
MTNKEKELQKKIISVAEEILYKQKYVSAIDIFFGIGWLNYSNFRQWKKGAIPFLESIIQTNLNKISFAMSCFRKWAQEKSLNPSETVYRVRTRDASQELRFCKSGDPDIEKAYRIHYVSPDLKNGKNKKSSSGSNSQTNTDELVVYEILTDSKCSKCPQTINKGELLYLELNSPLCMKCAKLDHLVFLPRGDASLTRKAKKASTLYAVVVKFNRKMKIYVRIGLLVEKESLP